MKLFFWLCMSFYPSLVFAKNLQLIEAHKSSGFALYRSGKCKIQCLKNHSQIINGKQCSVSSKSINIYDNEDMFTFQIKVNGKVVAQSIFSGNDYPPKVRYDVNIREII